MDLKLEILTMKEKLLGFGYDEVHDVHIEARVDFEGNLTHTMWARFEDDFQKSLPYEDRVQHGMECFYAEDGHFVIPHFFKSREQRELEVMVKKLGKTKELADAMTSAAGKEFARRLEEDLAKYKMIGVSE